MSEPILTLKYERGRKTWVAAIIGRSRQFSLDREFLGAFERTAGEAVYVLEPDQLYEVCELDERRFLVPIDGELKELTREQVLELVRLAEEERKKQAADNTAAVDNAILRINGEGGFSLN